MAFPVINGTPAESKQTTATSTHTISLPGSIVAGELLVVLFSHAVAVTANALTGWTELIDDGVANSITVLYRFADGAEGGSISLGTSATTKSASIAYRIGGAQNPAAHAPTISTVATGTSNAPNPTSCNPGTSMDFLWITFFVQAGEEADDDTWCNNAATGYTNLLQKTTDTSGAVTTNCSLAASNRTNTASSEDAAWPTGTTDQSLAWRAWTLGIWPASTGSLTKTLDSATVAGTANVTTPEKIGNLSVTLENASVAGTGNVTVKGDLSKTLDGATIAGTGLVTSGPVGDLSVTLGDASVASTGNISLNASLTKSLDNASVAGTGQVTSGPTANLSKTLDSLTVSGSGTIPLVVNLSVALANASVAGTGIVLSVCSGSLAKTLGDVTLSGTGHVFTPGPPGVSRWPYVYGGAWLPYGDD